MNLEVADIIAKCIDCEFDLLECHNSDHLLFAKFCNGAVHNIIVHRTSKHKIVYAAAWSNEIIDAADGYAKYGKVVRNSASESEFVWLTATSPPNSGILKVLQHLSDWAAHPRAGKILELKHYHLWKTSDWSEA